MTRGVSTRIRCWRAARCWIYCVMVCIFLCLPQACRPRIVKAVEMSSSRCSTYCRRSDCVCSPGTHTHTGWVLCVFWCTLGHTKKREACTPSRPDGQVRWLDIRCSSTRDFLPPAFSIIGWVMHVEHMLVYKLPRYLGTWIATYIAREGSGLFRIPTSSRLARNSLGSQCSAAPCLDRSEARRLGGEPSRYSAALALACAPFAFSRLRHLLLEAADWPTSQPATVSSNWAPGDAMDHPPPGPHGRRLCCPGGNGGPASRG